MQPYTLDKKIRVAQWVASTLSEGPYERFALWVQGCGIGCPGCCNPEMQDPAAGHEITVGELLGIILAEPDIEGVTLLGGEPFDQATSLGILASLIAGEGLGVITFSGYTLEALRRNPEAAVLLAASDILVDGPYIRAQHVSGRRLIGSANQHIHFLSERYRENAEFHRPGQSVHLSFGDGTMTITGFPDMFPGGLGTRSVHR